METTRLSRPAPENYERALEAAGIGIWDNDLLTDTIYLAGYGHELFGVPRGITLRLAGLMERIHPADRERTRELVKASTHPEVRQTYDNEYRIVAPGTEQLLRWVRSRGKVYFTEEGIPYRFTGTVQDITGEVRARETQQKLLALVDNSIELMSVLENDQTNSYINKAGMEMLGFDSKEQVHTTPITELHTPDDFEYVQANVLPSVLTTGRWSGVMNVRHLKTGEVFPVYNNTVRIHDPVTGEPLAVGAVMRDMRPEVAAKRALEESERNFRSLVMQAPVGICIIRGEELVYELANDSYLELARMKREDMIGRKLPEIQAEAVEQGFDKLLIDVLRTGRGFRGREFEVRQHRKEEVRLLYIDFSYEPLRDADGKITRIMVLAIDVTDKVLARKRLQDSEEELQRRVAERTRELEKKNAELEEFTYVTSHDLQEPIRKIRMFLQMVEEAEGHQFSDLSRQRFAKACDAAARMSQSLRELLDFTALPREEALEQVDLNRILEEAETDLELMIQQKSALVQRETLPGVKGIPQQLHRLFYNLLSNALKFSREGVPPVIEIRTRAAYRPGYCAIEVSDNGIGFDQEHAEKIFTLFQRLHTRQEYSGTGIGLALCRKVARHHGGDIRAESRPGEGARFVVELPVAEAIGERREA